MIHRDRPPDPPVILDLQNPQSPASKERQKVIDYVDHPDAKPKPKFSVYSRDEVKLALIDLFEGKCAYCETKVNAPAARDIEHYRPKARIDPGTGEEQIEPGYYWLAADWDNLLLSCPGCNRRQRQLEEFENGTIGFTEDAHGKLDLFPLVPHTPRARSHTDNLSMEEPGRLLLNPCLDQPEKHLRYDKEGHIFARKHGGKPSPKAVASIDAYVLWRMPLVKERKQRYLDMVNAWANIEQFAQMIDVLDAEHKRAIAQGVLRNEAVLLGFLDSKRSYAGMARWTSKRFLQELKKIRQRFATRFGESLESAAQ